jgi:protein ImuB
VLEAAGRILLERLLARLTLRNEGVFRFWCGLKFAPQGTCEANGFSVELVSPSTSLKHLAHLLDLRWERITLSGEVLRMRLEIAQTALIRYRQRELFEEETHKDRERRQEFAALVNRLSSRLGTEAVLRPVLMPDHQPEHAVRLLPVVRGHPPKKGKPKPQRGKRPPSPPPALIKFPLARPVCLLQEPVAIRVMSVVPDGPPIRFSWKGRTHVVARWWGPERIETGWWRSRDVRRDYYRVETGEGSRFWLFRDLTAEGTWFLHGIFE